MSKAVKEQFLEDVSNHSMEILNDEDGWRQLRFSNNGSSIFQFTITSWSGYLCVTGDMGTWVFSRITDMFSFFRRDELTTNFSYWMEKCQAISRHDSITAYDEDVARKMVTDHCKNNGWPEAATEEALDEIDFGTEEQFHRTIDGFSSSCDGAWIFVDTWEWKPHRNDYRAEWILYAIVWGIMQYDEAQK